MQSGIKLNCALECTVGIMGTSIEELADSVLSLEQQLMDQVVVMSIITKRY